MKWHYLREECGLATLRRVLSKQERREGGMYTFSSKMASQLRSIQSALSLLVEVHSAVVLTAAKKPASSAPCGQLAAIQFPGYRSGETADLTTPYDARGRKRANFDCLP